MYIHIYIYAYIFMYTQGLREGACKMFGMVLDGATQVSRD